MRTTLSVSHTSNAVFPIFPLTSSTFYRRRSFIHFSKLPLSRPIVLKASSSPSSTVQTTPCEKTDAENSSSNGVSPVKQDQFEIIEVKDRFIIPPFLSLSKSDQVFFLLIFIAATTSVAFVSLVVAAIPTLYAMGRAAMSLSKLADTAREELPSTMAAIRLSSMEISDLTLELNDLSQEIADGVNKSAQAVQAAEAGIRHIGSRAHQQTMSMIEERAKLPVISIQPVVTGAAKKTTRAVGQATKTLMNLISRAEFFSREDANNNDGGDEL